MPESFTTGAFALNSTHLELDKALPEDLGQRLRVHITSSKSAQNYTLRERQVAYQVRTVPETQVVLDARQAMVTANQFIVEHLPDRFSAGQPKLVVWGELPLRPLWLVPVYLTYPGIGAVGEVGMLAVDGGHPVVVGWTPAQEMESMAHQLYEKKRDEIELAFS